MRRLLLAFSCALISLAAPLSGQERGPRVLAFYSTHEEPDHVEFARQAVRFYAALAQRDHFSFQATTQWSDLNAANLSRCKVILWLDASPTEEQERRVFERYMEHGGAWMGFHAAGYNDASTHWPWFVNFLGAVFYGNSWPPLPAQLIVDNAANPISRRLPAKFISPANEWYSWRPDPRTSSDIEVLLTLAPANYPLGLKDTLMGGDVPVAWTNIRYRMIYVNMGHGGEIFSNSIQNRFFENALIWLCEKDKL